MAATANTLFCSPAHGVNRLMSNAERELRQQCYSSTGSDVYTVALMPAVMWAAPRVAPFARMAYGLAIRRGLAEYVRMSWSQPAAPLPPPIPPPSPRSPCQWCGPRCLPRWPMLLSRLASSAECLCSWLCSILPLF